MFELSIALRYLLPKFKQLSVSIISCVSILVIALVVWLAILFLSVTSGIEKNWIDKLVALNGQIQITPTKDYYNSYYYLIDSQSYLSQYQKKSLLEKQHSFPIDPWDPEIDSELPPSFPEKQLSQDGQPVDLIKELIASIQHVNPKAKFETYENSIAALRLRLLREHRNNYSFSPFATQSFINPQASSFSIVSSIEGCNPYLPSLIKPIQESDLSNLLYLISMSSDNTQEDSPSSDKTIRQGDLQQQLHRFFAHTEIKKIKTAPQGYFLPLSALPKNASFQGLAFLSPDHKVQKFILPKETNSLDSLEESYANSFFTQPQKGRLILQEGIAQVEINQTFFEVGNHFEVNLAGNTPLSVSLMKQNLDFISSIAKLPFELNDVFQKYPITTTITYNDCSIENASFNTVFTEQPSIEPFWSYYLKINDNLQLILPYDNLVGEGVLIAQKFQEKGSLLGDRGYLSFYISTSGSLQEQRIPFYVAGFYDTGVLHVGGKMVLTTPKTAHVIHNSNAQEYLPENEGFLVWLPKVVDIDSFQKKLLQELENKQIDRYWKIQNFRDYEFAKGLLQQFQSDKNLFILISIIIIIVACSNIISMLILLVNDKKKEIGILMSMGATSKSIAFIFGFCGTFMGILGSLIGTILAIITLNNLQLLVDAISYFQGFDAFNTAFYGPSLPNSLDPEILILVLVVTMVVSLIAGLIPAIKASQLKPTSILKEDS